MADSDEDDKTLDQSKSGEAEDQTAKSVEEAQEDDSDAGKAAEDVIEDDKEGEADKKPSRDERRHERYIDKLSSEIRQSNDQASRYTEELFAPKPYRPLEYKEDTEFDPKILEEDRKKVADNRFAEGIQQGLHQGTSQVVKELWADRFDIDSDRVTAKWDALNPDKTENYDSNLEADLVQKYISFTGVEKDDKGRVTIQRPNVRFKDFVEAEMKAREDYAAKHAAVSTKNIASQAAKTGVRPSGQGRVSKGDHGFDENDPVGSVNRMTSDQYFKLGGKEASDAYLAKRGLAPKV